MRRKIGHCLWLLLLLGLTIAAFALSQKVTTEVSSLSEILFSDPRVFEPPKNGIPLQKAFSFPEEPLAGGARISQDAAGAVYTADAGTNSIIKFAPSGERQAVFKASRKIWKGLGTPARVLIHDQSVLVQDLLQPQVSVFSGDGRQIRTIKIGSPVDFIIGPTGLVYAAPPVAARPSPLIEVFTAEGNKAGSFGVPKPMPFVDSELESIRLAPGPQGEILAAFRCFPILRSYSPRGQLIRETRVETLVTTLKEKFNLKRIGEGIARPDRRIGYVSILSAIAVWGDRVFLLSCYPRVDILEIDREGKIARIYWNDEEQVDQATDLLVREQQGMLFFYVLRTSPRCDIVVFGQKAAPPAR